MITIKGDKGEEMDLGGFTDLRVKFRSTVLDIGTGDGRFVYENALKDGNTLFIGIDPVERQLRKYSKKSNRKKLGNTLFILGSAENLPKELFFSIDKIYITFPWGSLLEKVVKGDTEFITGLHGLLKHRGLLEIHLGYSPDLEPSEIKRLDLPPIDEKFIQEKMIPKYSPYFLLEEIKKTDKENLDDIDSNWAKKLKHGRERSIFKICLQKI